MATRNIVPRANGEGSIGTSAKHWGAGYFDGLNTDAVMPINTNNSVGASNKKWKNGYFESLNADTMVVGSTNVGTKLASIDTQVTNNTNNITSLSNTVSSHTTKLNNLSIVNVKDYGAKGDGTTDDTSSIQNAINSNPGKMIFFPSGTYLISSTLKTSATDSEKVVLDLNNSTIKAKSGFSGSWMIDIGANGTEQSYFVTYHPTGIINGVIDGNGVASGGVRSEKTSCAHYENLFIINALKYGMQLDRTIDSGSGSSDAILFNINIIRYGNAANSTSVGLIVNSHDNNIIGVRTDKFTTGIKLVGYGNFLANCHPLYHNDGDNNTDLSSSIGFDISGNDTVMTDCYSDMFAKAVNIAEGKAVSIKNLIVTHDNDANTTLVRIAVKQNGSAIGDVTIDGLTFTNLRSGIKYVGYDGPTEVKTSSTFDVSIPKFEGIRVNRMTLQYPQTDKLLFSPFNTDVIRPKIQKYSTEVWDFNNIIAPGTWPVSGTFGTTQHVWADNLPLYGVLVVESSPRIQNSTYYAVVQKFIPDAVDYIYIRRYYAEAYPIGNASGWSAWKKIAIAGI